MYEYKTIININGYIIEKCVLFKDGVLQGITLGQDQQVVEYLDKSQTVNGRSVGYLKPVYVNNEWIETATQEELDEAYPPIPSPEPSLEERNRADIDYILVMQGL